MSEGCHFHNVEYSKKMSTCGPRAEKSFSIACNRKRIIYSHFIYRQVNGSGMHQD